MHALFEVKIFGKEIELEKQQYSIDLQMVVGHMLKKLRPCQKSQKFLK